MWRRERSMPGRVLSNPNKNLPIIGLEIPRFGQIVRQVAPVSTRNVEECLAIQRSTGGRLGDIMVAMNLISREDLLNVLAEQARLIARARSHDIAPDRFPITQPFSLCMPCFNEGGVIEENLQAACVILPEFFEEWEVIVVNDGSSDNTAALTSEFTQREPRVRLVNHSQNRGYGSAVTSGMRAADGELIAFTDGDGQFNLLDLPQLITNLSGADLVIGYRHQRADAGIRKFNAWSWNQLIRLVLGVKVKDLDCAFKVFRREVVDQLAMTAQGACINAEIMVQCFRGGLTVHEVPVAHYPRYHGAPTGANFRVILKAFNELPRLWKYRRTPPIRLDRALPGNSATIDSAAAVPRPIRDRSAQTNTLRSERRLKICMLAACPFPANHGTPGSIREMAEAVCELGHEVHVVTYHFGDETEIQGVHLHRIRPLTKDRRVVVGPTVKRPLYDLQMVFEAVRVVRRHKIDVVHAHAYEAALVAKLVRMMTGCRFVYSAHNRMGDELASYRFFRYRWLSDLIAWTLDATVPRMGDLCLPHSQNLEDFLHQKGLQDRCEPVLNFGIDLSQTPSGDGQRYVEKYDLGGGPTIVYAGVMNRFQRLDLLLEAMQRVLAQQPEAKLVLAVNVPNQEAEASVRQQAVALGIAQRLVITEPMNLEAVRELLQVCDVGVVPRPAAPGFPIKLLNYMAAKLPCVMFESSASRLQHGEQVFLAQSDTADSLGEALLTVIEDPSLGQRLAEAGYQFVRQHHDRRSTAQQVCRSYWRLLGQELPAEQPQPVTTLLDQVAITSEADEQVNGKAQPEGVSSGVR